MTHLNDTVILIHGLGGSRIDMWPIARRLKRLGYNVRCWSYRSLGNRVETHAQRLGTDLSELDHQISNGQFHLVTHSMGGIIARTMFAQWEFENLGRMVMLAPPNQGSHTARKLAPFIGWLTPSLEQLSDSSDSFVNQLPNTLMQRGIEFGIVESTKDRVIVQGGVHLEGFQDYARVAGHHGVLTWYADTIRYVVDFLSQGEFSPRHQHLLTEKE
ncbi:MAG: triacylglycerol lipase [Mariniblastus sp.]|jgi:triacylglycerol lipase